MGEIEKMLANTEGRAYITIYAGTDWGIIRQAAPEMKGTSSCSFVCL